MVKPRRVLFLGESPLSGPARYLAGVLTWAGIPYDHRQNGASIPPSLIKHHYDCFVLSDYQHDGFSKHAEGWLCEEVRKGTGFLMIGGWASFTGLVGGYSGTLIEKLLPVRCVTPDDRVNYAGGSVVVRQNSHPVLSRLSWNPSPMVCGYHRVHTKPGTETVLSLRDVRIPSGRPILGAPHPLLVLGAAGQGRTGAFMTDCAPHWCGGLVDWGPRRVTVRVAPGVSVEVGDHYLRFFKQLVCWLAD